jgi:hypothetical protein
MPVRVSVVVIPEGYPRCGGRRHDRTSAAAIRDHRALSCRWLADTPSCVSYGEFFSQARTGDSKKRVSARAAGKVDREPVVVKQFGEVKHPA